MLFQCFCNSSVSLNTQTLLLLSVIVTDNGSDMAQIGWVEVATEDGTSGYLWYLKAESETRLRFEDYLEMAVVEGENYTSGITRQLMSKELKVCLLLLKNVVNVLTGF
jgi:hypothetical protein